MRLEIKRLQRRLNTTSVYVTHDQVEAMTLADKLVVLNKGNVEQVGSPLEIYDQPASLFVATFMGSPAMNIVDATITPNGIDVGNVSLTCNTHPLELGAVKLGLRPEHLQLTTTTSWLQVEVELIEALGADLLLYCRTLDSSQQNLVIRADGHAKIAIGDRYGVEIKPEHIHLFDTSTEKRIKLKQTLTYSRVIDAKEVQHA